MRLSFFSILTLLLLPLFAVAIWPAPTSSSLGSAPLTFSDTLTLTSTYTNSDRLNRATDRYLDVLQNSSSDDGVITELVLILASSDESLSQATDYGYNVSSNTASITITASTIYGAMYALESLVQLSSHPSLPLSISDSPRYNHRGFMVDTGRRFVTVPLLLNQLDAMAIFKMNVMHLHFADWCRYAIESASFPELTAALTGEQAGFYTTVQVRQIIEYANDRGIRVIPEIDLPGHSTWGTPLAGEKLEYCTASFPPSLLDDASNTTLTTLQTLVKEIVAVFGEQSDMVHIGADETATLDDEGCTIENIAGLESKIMDYIVSLDKKPVVWEEGYFKSGGAEGFQGKAIINAWNAGPRPADIEAAGFDAIESLSDNFYLNNHPSASDVWADISAGDGDYDQVGLLGGEVSMWTDNYCYEAQCGQFGPGQPLPVGSALYSPSKDSEFARSFSAMVWPKAAIGGGAFWRYFEMTEEEVGAVSDAIVDVLESRGLDVCPKGCQCDEVTRCGENYIQ